MSVPLATDHPSSPEGWVQLYVGLLNDFSPSARGRMEEACRVLEQLIRGEADRVSRKMRLPDYLAGELSEDAARYFLFDPGLREKKQPQRISSYLADADRSLQKWLATKLGGRARNLLGRKATSSEELDQISAPPKAVPRPFPLEELRAVLVAWSREPVGDVDYFAVFASVIWLEIASRLPSERDPQPPPCSDDPVALIPAGTSERAFRQGWPILGTVWAAVQHRLHEPPHSLTGDQFCEIVQALPGGPASFSRSVWDKWKCLAKEEASRHYEPVQHRS